MQIQGIASIPRQAERFEAVGLEMNDERVRLLHEMGIVCWRQRKDESNSNSDIDSVAESTRITPIAETLDQLADKVSACRKCSLSDNRKKTVFGSGSENAEWMFVGEAPGAEEDRQGVPFVGRAGQLLNAMILASGLTREQTYIANVLKCRPPNNRDPFGQEVVQCMPYLLEQIERIQPRIIVALGRFAAQALLKTEIPIGKLRGKVFRYSRRDIPLVVTWHPAYLLRSPLEKRKTWQDLKLAMKAVENAASR